MLYLWVINREEMPFQEFVDYLQLEKNYSPHTIKAYVNDLKSFARFVQTTFLEDDIKQVNYSMVRSWIVQLVENGMTNRSVNRKISSLQAYYSYLLKTEQIKSSPLQKHRSLKVAKKVQVPFSEKEMERAIAMPVVEGFEGTRDKLMITMFYATGMRRSELIEIKLEDIQVDRKQIKINGKGNKERIIPLLSSVIEQLGLYLKERDKLPYIQDKDFLFLTHKGKKVYATLVYRIITQYFSKISSKSKVSPHVLRHTFATHLLNEGADINTIKSLLGHESLSSTQIYTHNDIAALRKVYKQAHPRNKITKK